MALKLTKEKRIHRIQYELIDGDFWIEFREFDTVKIKGEEVDERDLYFLNLHKIAGKKNTDKRWFELKKQVAEALIVNWGGKAMLDEYSEENKRKFLEEKEYRVFWYSYISRYLHPPIKENDTDDLPEEGEDPDFFAVRSNASGTVNEP